MAEGRKTMSGTYWAIAQLLVGTLLVAGGGLLATHGWDSWADLQRRRDVIRAVAAETMLNLSIVTDPKFTEKDPNVLRQFVIYPRFQTAALDGAIASALFAGENDRKLLTHLMAVREQTIDFNQRLGFSESQMARLPNEIAAYRETIREGQVRSKTEGELKALGQVLIDRYGLSPGTTFFSPGALRSDRTSTASE
jgi:hypothetical protein